VLWPTARRLLPPPAAVGAHRAGGAGRIVLRQCSRVHRCVHQVHMLLRLTPQLWWRGEYRVYLARHRRVCPHCTVLNASLLLTIAIASCT
jgi:hypothetical protein